MDDQRNVENFMGVLEVCVHEAKNINNICIYKNQDVYAKVFFISEPDRKISTKVINGGGRNPVFNETLRLHVPTTDSSLRCEVWMLSRIRNYLEDQLLGFVLLPLSDIVVYESGTGKAAGEIFELSSSELFHSPAGFVELSFKYTGTSPEVVEIMSKSRSSSGANVAKQDLDVDHSNICCELDKIEFPDQGIVNENERMVSEYLSCPCDELELELELELDPQVAGCENNNNNNNLMSADTDDNSLEKLADGDEGDNVVPTTLGVSPSNDSSPSVSNSVITETFSKSVCLDDSSLHKKDSVSSSTALHLSAKTEGKNVVQEEIVDMYMKGMQQFTDALAKMKLPMDNIADGMSAENDNINNSPEERGSVSPQKPKASKNADDPSARVFYGSRAFF